MNMKQIFTLPLMVLLAAAMFGGCGSGFKIFGKKDEPPKEITLPDDPIGRAAVQGLRTSYRDSTMWQIQNANVINITPVAPNSIVLQDHDPKELYCVCIEYEARYKVGWTTSEGSPWERTVRNILVMKTQADTYMAMRPMNICAPFCE